MDQQSVFFEEWLRSLREQYKHVMRENDRVTLPTLTAVMHEVGFSEDELARLRVEATMHIDSVGAEHAPDMNILQPTQPHPAECLCPDCMPVDESKFDADGQAIPQDPDQDEHESGHVFPAATLEPETGKAEPAPMTFEDSFADTDSDDAEVDELADSPDEDEADNPQQMSMF